MQKLCKLFAKEKKKKIPAFQTDPFVWNGGQIPLECPLETLKYSSFLRWDL